LTELSAEASRSRRFELLIVPHLDAAYNLARWLTRANHDAEDVVQEAAIKAFRFFDQCRADDPRAWFLTIVRNAAYSWLRNRRPQELLESVGAEDGYADLAADPATPESVALDQEATRVLNEAIENLPVPYREVVILREQEEFSYKQIAELTGAPIGTVMSRLARGRALLAKALGQSLPGTPGVRARTHGIDVGGGAGHAEKMGA
jgi:RNA polymerase sigma factor (sigma-70 family)